MERLVYKVNDKVVVIGESFYNTLLPRVNKQNKLCRIENFVDIELYKPYARNNAISKKYKLDDCFVVSYVGNIGNGQDYSPVIYAAENLKSLPIKFVFAGDGIRRNILEKEIEERNLSNVMLLGYVPRDVTPLINASSDVCLVLLSPHIKGDGFPSKIFSIMACARTAIVTADDGSDLKRVVQKSGCGHVVKVGDNDAFLKSVKKAYEEQDSLKSEGERARKYVVQNYSKEAIAIKYGKMIEELCLE
ncbi:MAG: glycosyltransferase family 4 protein [Bacteroidales bacterium]|nr:glycosyltransferase family 4 protein [Bacteroidales bacterium]